MSIGAKYIIIYSLKGGEGKSTIATNLSYENGWKIITNDVVFDTGYRLPKGCLIPIKDIAEMKQYIAKRPCDEVIICDLAGYAVDSGWKFFNAANLIIIPIRNKILSLSGLGATQDPIEGISGNKLLLVANELINDGELEEVRKVVSSHRNIKEAKILPLCKSQLFERTMVEIKSITELSSKSSLLRYSCRKAIAQFSVINNYVKEVLYAE